ncbi:hypothetical protein DAY19_02590 [Halobacteriovorax vibrionivorans]|uniref:Uncharacterized protein n=2 Tax=Halobacteriovoraceae TaxID=1652132 RepID=A0ABY0II94_9BACT|nr:porin [Halobacteriovorax sp. Y22]RZF22678.1 hypothetical protein DAY19_02590 [Halobacteriovorax vibrionivorans]TGD46699.1 hypothetical protein EP118_10975 [Halobacteriovorax sp. Y22]
MKKMTGIIAMAVLSSAAFANTIVPETSRDGKTKNSSAIAVTQQMRTFVAGEYMNETIEPDVANAKDLTDSGFSVFGGWSNKMVSVEADLSMSEQEDENTANSATDVSNYDVKVGYRINKEFALGLGYEMGTEEPTTGADTDTSKIELAGSYMMKDLMLGASFAINSRDNGTTDGSYNTLTVGVGSNANNMSWEAGLTYDMEEEDDLNRGSRFGLFAGMTKVVNNIEIDADLSYTTGDTTVTNPADYSVLDFNVDAEFLVTDMFYVTPGLYYTSAEGASYKALSGLDEYTIMGLSADFGYRANKVDATFGIDYDLASNYNTGSEEDMDRMAWKVNVAYNF